MELAAVATNPLAILKPTIPPRLYTLEEYLRREERSVEKHEYYDGKIIQLPMAKFNHNAISANTITAIKNAARQIGKRLLVLSSDQQVYLPKLNFGLYPDALVICEKPLFWDDNEVLLINPLLIVEVLSKSTGGYDKKGKFEEYKTLQSLKEYVLIEQNDYSVESRFREEPNLWRETFATDINDSIHLKSIGCTISLADIYEEIEFQPPAKKKSR